MKSNIDAKTITTQAVVAAIYVVLTWTVPAFSYGPIQFRIAEVLTLLAFYNSKYVYGLTIACAIANMISPFGIVDIFFGSLASFVALSMMARVSNIWLASIMPALSAPIIGFVIKLVSEESKSFFLITGEIMISEIIIVTIIGVPVMRQIMKNKTLKGYLLG